MVILKFSPRLLGRICEFSLVKVYIIQIMNVCCQFDHCTLFGNFRGQGKLDQFCGAIDPLSGGLG
jgi:hypothetical protein